VFEHNASYAKSNFGFFSKAACTDYRAGLPSRAPPVASTDETKYGQAIEAPANEMVGYG